MANFLNHVLGTGIAAIEEAIRGGPVQLMKRNRPAAVVMSEEHYRRLQHRASQAPVPEISSLEWLLQQPPSTTGRTRAEIDAELSEVRNW